MKSSILTKVCLSIVVACIPVSIMFSIGTVLYNMSTKHYWAATSLYYQAGSAYYDSEERGDALMAQADEEKAKGTKLNGRADQVIATWPYVVGSTVVVVLGFWFIPAGMRTLRRRSALQLR